MNLINQLKDVKRELQEFNKGNWKRLSKELALGITLLEEVNADNKLEGVEECFTVVIKHWIGKNYTNAKTNPPIRQNIAQAVKSQRYCSSKCHSKKKPIARYT